MTARHDDIFASLSVTPDVVLTIEDERGSLWIAGMIDDGLRGDEFAEERLTLSLRLAWMREGKNPDPMAFSMEHERLVALRGSGYPQPARRA